MKEKHDSIRAINWHDDSLFLLDQRILPQQNVEIELTNAVDVADAIRNMVVRGAPAIGITAAYGVVLAARLRYQQSADNWKQLIADDIKILSESRPTAVNLFWALEQMQQVINGIDGDPFAILKAAADQILEDDLQANYTMGRLGAALIAADSKAVLTHCNAGALATGGYGTALGVIRSAYAEGKINHVYADETRPWMQGSRLTAWEMVQDNIPVTLLSEGAAATLMKQGKISWIIVGSDRIAANGDVANKIGTYSLAVNARHHGVKFMVAAPTTTVDMNISHGDQIPIEQRSQEEVLCCGGQRIAAQGAIAWNPAFDVTPAELVDAIVTEKGVVEKPTLEKMQQMMGA
ncbi:MAG: S-methyl-5-thioribose-1-phosphate isomerase [Gammaproteobacteria bacterium]|nr:S-methyl-5-thioribose-1-phosphate isomerase [Gammaproteobacteria bacterium]MDH5736641.1 S-methyl-5-thioribose-1-phosphate isomerase [Gammaproteobacteria bacterium]